MYLNLARGINRIATATGRAGAERGFIDVVIFSLAGLAVTLLAISLGYINDPMLLLGP